MGHMVIFFGHDSSLDCTIEIHWYFSKLLREPCDFQQLDLRPSAPNFTFHMPTPPGCLDSGAPSVEHAQYPLWAPGWRQAPFLVPRSPFPFTVSPYLPSNFLGVIPNPWRFLRSTSTDTPRFKPCPVGGRLEGFEEMGCGVHYIAANFLPQFS